MRQLFGTDRGALKRILFNLLNNALKHGRDDIWFRVRSCGNSVWFLIGNRPADRALSNGKHRSGLGIGLRLVRVLASQLDGTCIAFRNKGFFWVRLRFPVTKTFFLQVKSAKQFSSQAPFHG